MDYGFDSIKLDGCGGERDLTQYAALFNATGKSILIENCHWGGTIPNATWCPWNYYRSSGDIRASYDSVVSNLQTTIPLAAQNLSTPGCWAYPDSESIFYYNGKIISAKIIILTEIFIHFLLLF
jgi:alpha-galactosidase